MSLGKCADCGHLCCNYITVKIPAPRTIRDFDGLLWQLSHENINAFRDHTGWHLIIYNPCSHLNRIGECAIYENRPITCREHSIENCEKNGPISESSRQYFRGFQELNEYCSKKFKTWNKRY